MNNLVKNLAIWLVIALVLLTVFKQFDTRTTTQAADGLLAVPRGGQARASIKSVVRSRAAR